MLFYVRNHKFEPYFFQMYVASVGVNEPQWHPQLWLQCFGSCFMTASTKVKALATASTWLLDAVPLLKEVLL